MRAPLLAAALAVAAVASIRAAEMTVQERSHLVAHLQMTGGWLVDEVSTLTPQQLAFRPSADSWTIMQVLEHLVVVGPIYWNDLQKSLRGKPSPPLATSGDANILWYGIDRAWREKAIPSEVPPGKLKDLKEGLEAYRKQHTQLLEYIRTTKDDLRGHHVDRQGCDAYQWALLISTHEQRHILQIREIKAHPNFPIK
ncbi:MAG TPA: DinB family protein [Vicinamibacterales bacterium]|jgi:hypothetical protein